MSTPLPITPGPSTSGFNPPAFFWDSRKKGPDTLGTLTFVLLRALDLPFQFWLLESGAGISLLRRLGLSAIQQPSPTSASAPSSFSLLGLSPYHTLILALATGSSLKQNYWKLFIGKEAMPPSFALSVGVYNTVMNSLNTIFALWTLTSQQPGNQSAFLNTMTSAPLALQVGLLLYATGLFTEWFSEIQRANFKSNPKNEGKPYSDGLFGFARNINYGGCTLWRTGYAMICGGWIWGAVMASWHMGYFLKSAVPCMEAYCEKRVRMKDMSF